MVRSLGIGFVCAHGRYGSGILTAQKSEKRSSAAEKQRVI
jgi:lipid-binding SYLF domain-containing protein